MKFSVKLVDLLPNLRRLVVGPLDAQVLGQYAFQRRHRRIHVSGKLLDVRAFDLPYRQSDGPGCLQFGMLGKSLLLVAGVRPKAKLTGHLGFGRIVRIDLDGAEVHHSRRVFVAANDVHHVAEVRGISTLHVEHHLAQLALVLEFAARMDGHLLIHRLDLPAGQIDIACLEPLGNCQR